MPKKGRRSQADQARETQPTFRRLRRQHSAIESNINALEHHGVNRCPDKGWSGFQRYVGFGILASHLHKIVTSYSSMTGNAPLDSRKPRSASVRRQTGGHRG